MKSELEKLLEAGDIAAAKAAHEANVDAQIAAAKAGATINLSDLFGDRDQIILAEMDQRADKHLTAIKEGKR